MTGQVMTEMVGRWRLERRDPNFEEFLLCRNVGWFLRDRVETSHWSRYCALIG